MIINILSLFILSLTEMSKEECGKRIYAEKNGCRGEADACRELCESNNEEESHDCA